MNVRHLIDFSEECAGAGNFEAAYHLLMAALHLCEQNFDERGVHDVVTAARNQGDAVESAVPPHRLSKAEAARRGTHSIYETLRVHADTVQLRMHSRTLQA